MQNALAKLLEWNEGYERIPYAKGLDPSQLSNFTQEDRDRIHSIAMSSLFIKDIWAEIGVGIKMMLPDMLPIRDLSVLKSCLLKISQEVLRAWLVENEANADLQRYLMHVSETRSATQATDILFSGINTAWNIIFAVIDLLPRLHLLQYGRAISDDTFEHALEDNDLLNFIRNLAGSSVEVFYHFVDSFGSCNPANSRINLNPQMFVMDEEGRVDVKLEALDQVEPIVAVVRYRLGCPARIVKGESKNVIDEMWELVCEKIREHIFKTSEPFDAFTTA